MRRFSILAFALTLAACDAADVDTPSATVLYVGNQGNFSDNSGSLTRYDLETGEATADALPGLGGLVQNLYAVGTTVYVLLNFDDSFTTGRGRIDVVDAVSRQRVDQLDVRTPRALAGRVFTSLGPEEVTVSNLYDDTVTPVNLVTGAVGTPIPVGPAPEGVATAGGRTYVANSGFGFGTSLTVLSTQAGAVIDTIDGLCNGPRTLLVDDQLEIWVICTGATDFATGEVTAPGQVVVLDAATGAVRHRVTVDGETLGSATLGVDGVFVRDGDRQEVYVIATGGVLRFDAATNTLATRIDVAGAPIGAVAYDGTRDRLFLGRPDAQNPYGADGRVTIHDRTGAEVGQFTAGIAPAAFAFASEKPSVEG